MKTKQAFMKKKLVDIPWEVRVMIPNLADRLGEERFQALFPDAPIVEFAKKGSLVANWSAYHAIFQAAAVARTMDKWSQVRRSDTIKRRQIGRWNMKISVREIGTAEIVRCGDRTWSRWVGSGTADGLTIEDEAGIAADPQSLGEMTLFDYIIFDYTSLAGGFKRQPAARLFKQQRNEAQDAAVKVIVEGTRGKVNYHREV